VSPLKDPVQARTAKQPEKQSYHEPLLIKHEPLRNITGQKYGEKTGFEKFQVED
jgi:hypothetical protein